MRNIGALVKGKPIGLPRQTSLMEAIEVMRRSSIGAVLIWDDERKPAGIFTERDFLTRIDLKNLTNSEGLKVGDVMTEGLIVVDADEDCRQVMELMRRKKIRHVPVRSKGDIVGIVSMRDLMEQYEKQLEQWLQEKESKLMESIYKVKESEERFRTIFNNSAVAITFADTKERIIAWNPKAASLLGIESSEMQNKSVRDLYPEKEWARIRSFNLREQGQSHYLETKIVTKDVGLIDIELSLSILKDTEGNIKGSIGIFRDISKRKIVEQKLYKALKELGDVKYGLDQHAIVAILDRQGKITYANDKFCQVLKFSKAEILSVGYQIMNQKLHSDSVYREFWNQLNQGKIWKGEIKNQTKEGGVYWMDASVVPFMDEKNEPYQFIAIMTDITVRKKHEEELVLLNRDLTKNTDLLRQMVADRESIHKKLSEEQDQIIQIEKMATLGTLAAGFAHSIKNPLAIILQGMERIRKVFGANNDTNNLQFADMIIKAASRANTVVTSLLKYSRGSHLDPKEGNLFEIIETARALVSDKAGLANVEILNSFPNAGETIVADQIMLQQVFFDLFNNAIDAMLSGGTVEVNGRFDPKKEIIYRDSKINGAYVISVRDTGEGIEEKHLKRVFDPFFTTKDEGQGTGLGLSTAHLILVRHHGTIDVESSPGKGTTFTVTLPKYYQEE